MKQIILILALLLLAVSANAQITRATPLGETTGTPAHTPGAFGSWVVFDKTANKLWVWNGAAWEELNISTLDNDSGYLDTETDPTVSAGIKAITAQQITNWDLAHGWGDHSAPGYITGYTETDPTVSATVKAITAQNVTDWSTAFGWGDHDAVGYITSQTDDQTATEVPVTPTGNLNSTDVQAALVEHQGDIDALASGAADGVAQSGSYDAANEEIDMTIGSPGSDFSIDISGAIQVGQDSAAAIRGDLRELAYSADWSNIDNIPVGIADGDDTGTDDQTAAEVIVTPSGNLASTDVQAALQEVQAELDGQTDDQNASEVSVSAITNLTATDVQAALAEHQGDIDALAGGSADGVATAGTYDAANEEIDVSVNAPGSNFSIPVAALVQVGQDSAAAIRGDLRQLAYSADWSNIDSRPSGLDDGDDDTQLTQEQVEDFAGGLFTGNTETRGSLTYNDGTGKVDLVVDAAAWADVTGKPAGFADNIDNVDDADADPNNEIELPGGDTNGQFLSTTGGGSYVWVANPDTDTQLSNAQVSSAFLAINPNTDLDDTDDFNGAYGSLTGAPTLYWDAGVTGGGTATSETAVSLGQTTTAANTLTTLFSDYQFNGGYTNVDWNSTDLNPNFEFQNSGVSRGNLTWSASALKLQSTGVRLDIIGGSQNESITYQGSDHLWTIGATTKMYLDGTDFSLSTPLEMGANKITNIANGTVATDAAAFGQLHDAVTFGGFNSSALTISGQELTLNDDNLRTNIDLDDVVTLTGVIRGATNLGSFTGGIISGSPSIKTALQDLADEFSNQTDDQTLSEVLTQGSSAGGTGITNIPSLTSSTGNLTIDGTAGTLYLTSPTISASTGGSGLFVLTSTNMDMAVPIEMSAQKITGLADPTNPQDAATRQWVLDQGYGAGGGDDYLTTVVTSVNSIDFTPHQGTAQDASLKTAIITTGDADATAGTLDLTVAIPSGVLQDSNRGPAYVEITGSYTVDLGATNDGNTLKTYAIGDYSEFNPLIYVEGNNLRVEWNNTSDLLARVNVRLTYLSN